MPIELLLVLAALAVAAGILTFARIFAAAQSDSTTVTTARLRQREEWLQARLHTAEREAWEASMRASLTAQLAATRAQLATVSSGNRA